jgi:hypothetical protein
MDGNAYGKPDCVLKRFPADCDNIPADTANPAIQLYGRRFYKDQTPVEYLAEFLLVFASPKQADGRGAHGFALLAKPRKPPRYWPENHVALKLFAFFPNSRLETRHPAHRKAYRQALDVVQACVKNCTKDSQEETVRLLQSLFAGFVGVAKNRTWVTHTFLPVSTSLLAKEVSWQHPQALKDKDVVDWDTSLKHFDENTRNFLGRGGELLFLQLATVFAEPNAPELAIMLASEAYRHLGGKPIRALAEGLERQLRQMLEEAVAPLTGLARLIEDNLAHYRLESPYPDPGSSLGWVTASSRNEALLFAWEMDNICAANLSGLERLDLLQTLCSMQVLRSLCFQARRVDEAETDTPGFIGNYAWIVADPNAPVSAPIRLMAQNSFSRIDDMLYRAMRSPCLFNEGKPLESKDVSNGDDNCFRHFRKLSKELGLVVPPKGRDQRFVLTPGLLRFLVAALVPPGKRVRLSDFYQRAIAHYGLALGGQALTTALDWNGSEADAKSYAVATSTAWIEEALQQGGFLIELSDAVSIVHNPAKRNEA